jgi:hypothetical protein
MGRRITEVVDWLLGRTTEATAQQRWATGASAGAGWLDPIDAANGVGSAYGFRRRGGGGAREIPQRTREQAQVDSIVAYRANPMGRAILDTYVGFCVGDSGLTVQCTSDVVRPFIDQFWEDPRNAFELGQETMMRDWLIRGEQAQEMLVGALSGVVRRSPIDVGRVAEVQLLDGNVLWPDKLGITSGGMGDLTYLDVVGLDDVTGLRQGDVLWWPAFKTLETDVRGSPFLMPVIDWLDNYDSVLSNLIDRTALMRYISWDVTLKGADGPAIEKWIADRGGKHIPRSGTMEVHNDTVEMTPTFAQTGAYEDVKTNAAILTNIAGGAGLSKVWLAEPEDANRATSQSMAEPVRRRLGSVQNQWVANIREMCRFAVDSAVAAGRIPAMVDLVEAGGEVRQVPAAMTVSVAGPQIAAADSQMMATVMLQLSQALQQFVDAGVMSTEAAKLAAQKAWSDYCGTPYRSELDAPTEEGPPEQGDVDALAEHVEDSGGVMPLVAA